MTKDGFIYIHIPTCQITYIDHVPHVVLCTYKFDNMIYKHGFRWIIQHGTSYQVTKDINCQTYEIVNLKYQARNVEWLHIWRYICLDFVWLSKHKFIYRSSDSISIILSPEDWMRGVPSKMMHCQKGSKGDMQRMMCVQYIRIYTHNFPYWVRRDLQLLDPRWGESVLGRHLVLRGLLCGTM